MRRLIIAATLSVAALGMLLGFAGAAAADSTGPITFETGQGYALGTISGQQGWTKTGSYDANVVSTARYGFGQALQISDATTSGSFGDQTFSPSLTQAAGESAQTHFEASFQIGTTSADVQPGSHLSVSPDNGSGGRMSYLRFEDQTDGIHVFFDDVTDAGPFYTLATFNETDIATLARPTAHTIKFAIDFKPGPGNDVVTISIDGSVVKTGTTWENYYRFDNENQGSPAPVPTTSSLLFRESGTANNDDLGNGFLVDNVSLASSMTPPACTPTGFFRDSINLTAKQIGGNVTGDLDATGCNIGVYYGPGSTGTVNAANVHGANYFGVVNNGGNVSVTNSTITQIGESPFNGTQHGVGIYFAAEGNSTGTIQSNTVSHYQKNGIVVNGVGSSATISGNNVVGEGPVSYIAQNGIEVGYGATGTVTGNTVFGNAYTGPNGASSTGILVFGGAWLGAGVPYTTGVSVTKNTLTNNDVGIDFFNADASFNAPATKTNDVAVNNTISNTQLTNTTGENSTCGYQAGISDFGNKDNIVNNKISGVGTSTRECSVTLPSLFIRPIDTTGSAHAHVNNNK
jgi:Right handed beta helix region